jgi:hypothetical protein
MNLLTKRGAQCTFGAGVLYPVVYTLGLYCDEMLADDGMSLDAP